MIRIIATFLLCSALLQASFGQEIIPLDTVNWEFSGSYIMEPYKGQDALYIKGGSITLKNTKFLNGTIEFDMFLKEAPSFPGINFRVVNGSDGEQFYVRPHQSGNPDANQAAPIVKGISPWQLYYGTRYSFPYEYKFDDWTHIKLVVNDDKAQVFLDHSDVPNLSWMLTHGFAEGDIILRGGGKEAIHIANVSINEAADELIDFSPIEREPIEGLISEWELSDMFEEKQLADPNSLTGVIGERTWGTKVQVEEGTAANISRQVELYNGEPGNTVFARININSDKDQIKKFEFGYSDRVVAILNGKPMYWGNNRWRSRDYRYLGTIGLFDAIYLDLKKGDNELLFAVSEDFGGWLITGKFEDSDGLKVK